MLSNKLYNLMQQLVQENKSLWRIKNNYIEECGDDEPLREFMQRMEQDKEQHIEDLKGLIKDRINDE